MDITSLSEDVSKSQARSREARHDWTNWAMEESSNLLVRKLFVLEQDNDLPVFEGKFLDHETNLLTLNLSYVVSMGILRHVGGLIRSAFIGIEFDHRWSRSPLTQLVEPNVA
jgi:hypothetical protein